MVKQIIELFFLSSVIFFFSYTHLAASSRSQGMVVTEQHLASDVGAKILREGGNAIDAAVAVGYALAVVNPCCGNIGGGGFMTIHFANGKNVFLNFRERAPFAVKQADYLDTTGQVDPKKSTQGYLAVAVPGTVLGFETILNKYGTLSRQKVMAPAIQLASKGFILQKGDVDLLVPNTEIFAKQPNVAAIFLKNNLPYQVGDRLIQTDLASTLQLISAKGTEAFYKGEIADAIIKASQKNGGILTKKDFTKYVVEETSPILCRYRGYTILSAPPPSSGGVALCEILNILEGYPLRDFGQFSPKSLYYLIEAMGLAFLDRNTQLGDPDFVNNPVEKLLSKKYAAQLRKKIPAYPQSSPITLDRQSIKEGMHTTHYSVIDKMGNAVSVTYTLNSFFGAKVIAGHTGFFLNDEMDDFAIGSQNQFGLTQGLKNKISPGKRPLSSMTPSIILHPDLSKKNQVFMIVGSPGGPRIITATLLTILNVIDYRMDIQSAVNAGRIHYQYSPPIIDMEPYALSQEAIRFLSQRNFKIQERAKWGAVEAIYVDPITQKVTGANDIRRPAGSVAAVY